MAKYHAAFRFRAGGFDLKAEAFGRVWEFERDRRSVHLTLPFRPDSFAAHDDALQMSMHTGDLETAWDDGRVLVAAALMFEVSVDVDVELSSTDLVPEKNLDELRRGQKAFDSAFPTALAVAVDFISWLRVLADRYWLPSSDHPPEVLNGWLFDAQSGARVRNISFSPIINVRGFGRDAGLTLLDLDPIGELLGQGSAPNPPEVLLADAREALTGPPAEQGWRSALRDVRRAILLAAIACEVKIKTTLDTKTSVEKKPLVDIILKNFREVEVAIGQLPHKTMKAALGRSLHKDDQQLFDAIQKLFTHRNHIAHRGEAPTLEQARVDIDAAVKLFAWLDALPDPHQSAKVPESDATDPQASS